MNAFSSWLENPIVTRETRARWRGRAFVVLFGYAFLLGAAMLWAYGNANYNGYQESSDGLGHMARVGHDLFLALSAIQIGCWMLLAPALTATSIAWERETGLLESIQLSPLPGSKIIAGKLLSVLFFIGLLLFAALPVSSICFLMGGVSPEEFEVAFLLQVVTAITGTFIGLCCSALCRRANIALALTFGVMIVWFFGSLVCSALFIIPTTGFNNVFNGVVGRSNPLLAVLDLTSSYTTRGLLRMASGSTIPWFYELPMWKSCIFIQMTIWIPCFWLAARQAGRPFPEAAWMGEKKRTAQKERGVDATFAPHTAAQTAASPATDGAYASPVRGTTSKRWNSPLAERIHSNNPVFQREARSKFRLRRLPLVPAALGVCLLLFVGYWYLRGMDLLLNEPDSRLPIWIIVNFLWLILLVLCSAIMGGSGLSREREAGTWEGLGMSLLSAREIVAAKMRAPLLALAIYPLPLCPLLLLCALPTNHPRSYGYGPSLGFGQICGSLLLQFTTTCFVLALGLWLSWRGKRTAIAIGWVIGLLVVGWAFVPVFIMVSVSYPVQRFWSDFFQTTNPFFALGFLADNSESQADTAFMRAIFCSGLLWAASSALLFSLYRSIETRRFGLFAR